MNRLISLEPSNVVPIRVEPGERSSGHLTLLNVMHTMPVAFRLQPQLRSRYSVRPQSAIIAPLQKLSLEIVYHLPPGTDVPDDFPISGDSFLLHSVVVPGAAVKDYSSTYDAVPADWFTARKKQVFTDSGIRIMFVGSVVLASLVAGGEMDDVRAVLEKSDPSWKAADSVDSDGDSLLHIAIARRRPDLVQLILEFSPDLEVQSKLGKTAMESAVDSGEALIVELLLARKASTDRSEGSDLGPIHLAAGNGHVDILRLLILKGASVDAPARDGSTALHLAVAERQWDCTRLLLASRADPNVRDAGDGDAPIHVAASLGDEKAVKLLLENGANKDIRNYRGRTSYEATAENGHTRLFDALRLGDGLCVAARKGEARAVVRLLDGGAAVNGQDQRGWTALHRACFKGRADAARCLLEKGAEVGAKDDDGYTALHCAAEAGHVDVVELLLKRGADAEAATNKGVTVLQMAESLGYPGIAKVLAAGKAEASAVGAKRKTKKRVAGGRLIPVNASGRPMSLPVV